MRAAIFLLHFFSPACSALRTSPLSRRQACIAAAASCLSPWAASAYVEGDVNGNAGEKCRTSSTPSTTVVTCRGFGLSADERVAGCTADEACIATSAVSNPSKYGPPWRPSNSGEASEPDRAWRAVVSAVIDEPSLTIADQDGVRRYLRATAPAQVAGVDGTDDVEFILRDGVLLYRSATRQSVYLYPLQQPVANQESHRQRLSSIRRRLGWEEAGLPTDGEDLAADMQTRYGVPTAKRWFGIELGGMRVPEDDEY